MVDRGDHDDSSSFESIHEATFDDLVSTLVPHRIRSMSVDVKAR